MTAPPHAGPEHEAPRTVRRRDRPRPTRRLGLRVGRGRAGGVRFLVPGAPSWSGVRTVAGLDLRRRLRGPRWPGLLVAWLLAVYGLITLAWFATSGSAAGARGIVVHSLTTSFVLGAGLLVVPAATATLLGGDRRRGTLAVLQATRLGAAEIVLGKLLGAGAMVGVLVLLALPAWGFALAAGGVTPGRLALGIALVAGCLASVGAIGLACSARVAHPAASTALTYGVVTLLTVGTVVLHGAVTGLTARTAAREVRVVDPADPRVARCVTVTAQRRETHPELTWWLLAPNPFVVVADAAPAGAGPARSTGGTGTGAGVESVFDPLTAVRDGVRASRLGPDAAPLDECPAGAAGADDDAESDARARVEADAMARLAAAAPVWPLGAVILAVAGVAAARTAIRLVRIPSGRVTRRRPTS